MDLFYFKIVLLVNGWLFAVGSPVAMLQHATSSQSIVFHQDLSPSAPTVNTPSPVFKSSDSQPGYEYKYEVSDQHTGDRKSHWESREGDRVRGSYTLYEPDGAVRTVEYTVDAEHGFNAVVTRNVPKKHQYPDQTINSNQVSNHNSESSRNGGYTSNKNTFSSQSSDEATGYSVSSRQRSGDVGFSVIHEARNSGRDASQLY